MSRGTILLVIQDMGKIREIVGILGAGKIVFGLILFACGYGFLQWSMLWAVDKRAGQTTEQLMALRRHYAALKSVPVDSALQHLRAQVARLQKKLDTIHARKVAVEEIPLLVSRIGKRAERVGLNTVKISVQQESEPEDGRPARVHARLELVGEYAGVPALLAAFDELDPLVFISSFNVHRAGKIGSDVAVSLHLISYIRENDEPEDSVTE